MELFKLFARLLLDRSGYEKGMEEAVSSGKSFASRLGSGLKTAAKVGGAALAAASGAMAAVTKTAIDQYAEYEQLVGGVETLFKGSAGRVQEYAANAYKTAGLSANEYMATVTSFSASLLQSLGGDTAAAADLADQAITDMSDNANKMGTDMSAIQNAYQGFSKGQYQLLDNLKLGYGGTKQEMERLLADAEKLSGQKFDISSYADVVRAIHVVQTEMGITGTTAKEASQTISGSVAAMKTAWSNLVTGIADNNADLGKLIDNFVDSASTAADNLIPRVAQVMEGFGQLVGRIAPIIADRLPSIMQNILPTLISAAKSMLSAVFKALPDILRVVIDQLPSLIEAGLQIILELAMAIAEALPELIPAIVDVIIKIVEILTDPDNLSRLVDAAIAIILALVEGIIDALPRLIEAAPRIIMNLVEAIVRNLPKILEAGGKIILMLAKGIVQGIGKIGEAMGQIIGKIGEGIRGVIDGALQWGKDLINNFTNGIKEFINKPIEAVKGLAGKIKSFLGFSEPEEGPLSNFHTFAPDMMELFAKGIRDNVDLITDAIDTGFDLGPAIRNATPAPTVAGQEFTTPVQPAGGRQEAVMQVDRTVFARLIYRLYNEEAARVGVSLAGGVL